MNKEIDKKEPRAKRRRKTDAPKLPESDPEYEISSFEFYARCYLKSAKQTLSYAIPAYAADVPGTTGHIARVILEIESAERLVVRAIDRLKASIKQTPSTQQLNNSTTQQLKQ